MEQVLAHPIQTPSKLLRCTARQVAVTQCSFYYLETLGPVLQRGLSYVTGRGAAQNHAQDLKGLARVKLPIGHSTVPKQRSDQPCEALHRMLN